MLTISTTTFVASCRYLPLDVFLSPHGTIQYNSTAVNGKYPMYTTASTSRYPGWIKSPHVVTLGIPKLSGGRGYSGINFGHPKSEVFRNGGGYSRINFGHPKSEVFRNGGVFQSKLWSSQI